MKRCLAVELSVGVYRRLLLVYPPEFRRRHADRMVGTFAEICAVTRAEAGVSGLLILWLRTFADLLRNGLAERRSPRPDSRAPRNGVLMEDLRADLRFALRTLRRNPGYAAVAIVTMALGVGVNAAVFSFVDAVVLRPLPFPDPDELVQLFETYEAEQLERRAVGYPTMLDWRERIASIESIAASTGGSVTLTGGGEAQRFTAQFTDPEYFEILGARPLIGRTLLPDDNREAAQAPVAVLSHGMWERAFGADAAVVDSVVRLNGVGTTVVGVMPETFTDPYGVTDVWIPLRSAAQLSPAAFDLESRGNRGLATVARMAPDASLEQVQAELDAVTRQLREEHPDRYVDRGALVVGLEQQVLGATQTPVLMLMGAVGLVLLIACANVANLMLARAAGRGEEIAMRFALGAERSRIVRQLLTESCLLALLGGAVGLLLAVWLLSALATRVPFNLPGYVTVGMSGTVLLFTVALAVVTGVLFGLLPALTASGRHLARSISGSRGVGRRGVRIAGLDARGVLVVAEVALSVTLLVGAGLLLRSFAGMQRIDPGFVPERLLTAAIELPESRYDTEQMSVFRNELLGNLRGVAGVEAAAVAGDVPLISGYSATVMATEEGAAAEPMERIRVYRHSVSPGYIDALGAGLIAGRPFASTDTATAAPVMIVSETMAARTWPGEEAVGKRLTPNGRDWITVVGVVRDIRHRQLVVDTFVNPDDPDVYFPLAQAPRRGLRILVRSEGDPRALVEPLTRQVRQLDADLPIFSVSSMQQVVDDALAVSRVSAGALTAFGGLALLLAGIGIYGVMATAVSARRREIGIRVTLGARRVDVIRAVLRQSLTLAGLGVAVGILVALVAARFLGSLLYGVSATDPLTIGVVAALLLVASMLATCLPLRRALRVSPATALQEA